MRGCRVACLSAHWRSGDSFGRGKHRWGGPGRGYRAPGRRAVDSFSARGAGARTWRGTALPASPRPLGFDEQGREVLTFLPGETVGNFRPWPGWVYAEDTFVQ